MLLANAGMQTRLLEALDLKSGLAKGAEGQIARIVVDRRGRGDVDKAERVGENRIYLKRLPLGFWVRMERCASAPVADDLQRHDDSPAGDLMGPPVFVEPRTSE
eukprot:477828-Pyramimonas_sp.AAC.1